MIEENEGFFYDRDSTNPFYNLWCKLPQYFPKDLEKTPVDAKGVLFKKGKTLKLTKNRIYCISGEYMYYKEKEEAKKIKGLLQFVNVSYIAKTDKITGKAVKTMYFLRLQRNTAKTKLFTFDPDVYAAFHRALTSRCILNSFQTDYKLLKMIGKGSFAKVYLAQNLNTKENYAVKAFYKDQVLAQSSGHDALINEINVMRRLAGNKALLHLYQVYESKNSIYFIIDLLEGGELLHDLKPEHPYKESKIALLLHNILEALCVIHDKGIIHRDLKPENILLRNKNNPTDVVIADFGLATPIHKDIKNIVFKRCGTPGYVAPEVLFFKEGHNFYGCNSDIFSVGVIFYIMVTGGTRPFKGGDAQETLAINKRCQPNYNRPGMEKLTPHSLELMKLMLAADPKKRITAHDALQHDFFKMSDKDHDVNFKEEAGIHSDSSLFGSLKKINEKEEEERKSIGITSHNESQTNRIGEKNEIITDSTAKLMNSPSNNFEYRNNCMNGRIDTVADSTKMSYFKSDEDNDSIKSGNSSPVKMNSRFSSIGGASPNPKMALEKGNEVVVRRSTGNMNRDEDEHDERMNRSSLSPSHKKPNKGNEIYKMAIMNQKKKSDFEMLKN